MAGRSRQESKRTGVVKLETLLFLVPIIGCLAIALGRVTSFRAAKVEGTPVGEVALNFRERVQYHRGAI